MQTTQAMWYGWIVDNREGDTVVWSQKSGDHRPILTAIKLELNRLGEIRPHIVAEWPDFIRPSGACSSNAAIAL